MVRRAEHTAVRGVVVGIACARGISEAAIVAHSVTAADTRADLAEAWATEAAVGSTVTIHAEAVQATPLDRVVGDATHSAVTATVATTTDGTILTGEVAG
jgi:hypothetical protein